MFFNNFQLLDDLVPTSVADSCSWLTDVSSSAVIVHLSQRAL